MSNTTGKKNQSPPLGRFFLYVAGWLVLLPATWVGISVLASGLLPKVDPLWRGAGAAFTAVLIIFFVSFLAGFFLRRTRPDSFEPFNEAFVRITQGDYGVNLPVDDDRFGFLGDHLGPMAENVNTMAGALARMEELRRQFVADVSHEFQSPLTSILGFTQALRSETLSPDLRQRYLGIVEAEARRLSRLSDNLLKLSALDDRDGPPDPVPFRVDAQIRQVLVALEPQWSAKGLRVEADLADQVLVGNEGLWAQVWTNLIHNAVKFTPAGGQVTVRLVPGKPVRIEVEDSGIGLTPDEAARVFERFYKADSARTQADGVSGSGLGLALVQRIVQLHGGVVEALSPGPGLGTMLRVTLPPSGLSG